MKSLLFAQLLIAWYQKNARDLPWRRTKDPYKIWISEIMLQQTTVQAVIAYYERWIKVFPTVKDLAKAPLQKVLSMWQGLGYYNRAKNAHKSARIMVDQHLASIPNDSDIARQLPGFGPYTVGAVLSIAYDKKLPIIDANVRRVLMRVLAIEGEADTRNDAQILEFLNSVLPDRDVGDFNQGLMELGALVCRSKAPQCEVCPLSRFCRAFKEGKTAEIPAPRTKEIKQIDAVIAIIQNKNKYFIQKRPSKGLLADLWEFPGGKVEPGETREAAIIREVKEELGILPRQVKFLFDVEHFYTQFKVKLSVWKFDPASMPGVDATHKWVLPKDFSKYPMPSGSVKIVKKLKIKT